MDIELLQKYNLLLSKHIKIQEKLNRFLECLLRYLKTNRDKRLILLMEEYCLFDKEM